MEQGCRGRAIVGGVLLLLVAGSAPAVLAQCIGDCDGNGHVNAGEVATGVGIALLELPPSACSSYGSTVEVDDLVDAVNEIIHGCLPTPTPTATLTPTITSTPLPTKTPGGVPNAVAGGAAVVAKSMGGIPSLVTAIVTGLTKGGSGAGAALPPGGGAAGACPQGGSATRTCTTPAGGGAQLDLMLSMCAVSVPDGTLTFNTTLAPITLLSTAPAACPSGVSPFVPINATADVSGIVRDPAQNILLSSRATLTAVVNAQIPFPVPVCVVSGAQLTVTGPLSSAIPNDGNAVLNFLQTNVSLAITSFNGDCVPVDYTLTFNGHAQVRDTSMETAPVTFDDLVVHVNATGSPTTLEMDGGLNFDCIDGAITLDTTTPLTAVPGQICPTGGQIHITSPEGPSAIRYLADGAVEVDVNNDSVFEKMFDSCSDPMLRLCPQQS